jgi:hypothetical protein
LIFVKIFSVPAGMMKLPIVLALRQKEMMMTIPPRSLKFFALAGMFFSTGLAASLAGTMMPNDGDALLTARVEEALLADPELKAIPVNADALRGTVTLNGAVNTLSEAAEAVKAAKMVDGVAYVIDNLSVANHEVE